MENQLKTSTNRTILGLLIAASLAACGERADREAATAAPKASTETVSVEPHGSPPSPPANRPVAALQFALPDEAAAKPSSSVAEPERSAPVSEPKPNRLEACGTAEFGRGTKATRLPLRCIRANYAIDGPDGPPALAPQQPIRVEAYMIPSRFRTSLAAYWMNLGNNEHGVLLLAPKDWSLVSADVGANGSHVIRLAHPDDAEQFLDYFDQGGCQGCLIPSIGSYFPQLRTWAEEQGYEVAPRPEIEERAMLTPNLVAYRKQTEKSGYAAHGVAYQEHGGGGGIFRALEIQLPGSDKAAATAILNLFVALHREPLE